jgi:hypothetical protein
MVTAETAFVLPIVAAFALTMLWLVSVAISQVRLVDAARDAARGIARGDDLASVERQVAATAPPGVHVDVTQLSGEVTVDVAAVAEPPGWLLVPMPGISLHASATTEAEAPADAR